MRLLLSLIAFMAVMAVTPAFACSCAPDASGAVAQGVLADQSYSVAKVYVRGMNTRNGQSMLELKETVWGGLMAQNFRAKFDGASSCGVVPQNKQIQTLLIHFEKDGTYKIAGQCQYTAVMQYLKNNPQASQGQ